MAIRTFNLYTVSITGPLNPAINTWHVANDAEDNATVAAQLIGFTALALSISAAACSLDRITVSTGGGPAIDVPFPDSELSAINGAVDAPYNASVAEGGYGVPIGSGSYLPIGSSLLLTEFTAIGGRHNGRKYLPWTEQGAVDGSTGTVQASVIGNIRAYYLYWLLATNPSGGAAAGIPDTIAPVAGATNSPIGDVKVSGAVARLRSRIR